jgi:hypothetical protein
MAETINKKSKLSGVLLGDCKKGLLALRRAVSYSDRAAMLLFFFFFLIAGNAAFAQKVEQPPPGSAPASNTPNSDPGKAVNAQMTQDLIIIKREEVAPSTTRTPLSTSVKVKVENRQALPHDLYGITVNVTNEADRPVVIDGDNAKSVGVGESRACLSTSELEKQIAPSRGAKDLARVSKKVSLAAASIGLVPTARDYFKINGPLSARYGQDEKRRSAEISRLGRRIVFPHEHTEGIIFFDMKNLPAPERIELPVSALFETEDSSLIKTELP